MTLNDQHPNPTGGVMKSAIKAIEASQRTIVRHTAAVKNHDMGCHLSSLFDIIGGSNLRYEVLCSIADMDKMTAI
jgi:hypothetical protein